MARKRMIKPDFWQSPTLARLDHFSRLLFIGLWQVADDHGNGPMEAALLAAELFPFDLSRDTQDILTACSRGTQAIAEQGLIRVYEVNGREFYSVTGFQEHQKINRPSNPVYPGPDKGVYKDSQHTHNTLTEDVGDTQATLTLKLREEKLREEEDKGDSDEPPQDVEEVRQDVQNLCEHLQAKIVQLGSKKPNINKTWLDQARLLLDADHRPEQEAHHLIDWALSHNFWKAHITSMKKFREKYDTMRIQAQDQHKGGGRYPSAQERKDQAFQELAQRWAPTTPPVIGEIEP